MSAQLLASSGAGWAAAPQSGSICPPAGTICALCVTLAPRGRDSLRHTSQYLRDSARQSSDNTKSYIRDEPVKAVLIAAATGAVLAALVNLLGHSRNRH